MPHDTPLITTIVAALVLAFIFGAIANRLKMPPLVGYLIAGMVVGPHSPGFVADQTLASQLADLGVVLLMFGVGLNFSMSELLSVKAVAVPGALIRIVLATAMGMALGISMGWSVAGGLVFGLGLAVSSTVVTLKVLQDRHLIDSDRGRIAVGWLVVEDLAMVLALVLIPVFAGVAGGSTADQESDAFIALAEQLLHTHLVLWEVIVVTIIKLLAFVGFMVVVGRRIIPFVLHMTAHTGSRELFRLAVLAIALGVAAGAAYLFGVSLALGAFFAGMILSESQLSQRAAQETLPLRDAFGVLFFVSVGMLFDPTIIFTAPLPLLGTVAIILIGKSVVAFLLMLVFQRPVSAALTVTASLAQIGEFSFILAALGVSLGVMPEEARELILGGSIISIVLNPLVFWASERMRVRLDARTAIHRAEPELGPVVPSGAAEPSMSALVENEETSAEQHATALHNHVVLVGFGRVGAVVAGELAQEKVPFVLIEDAEGRVAAAREAGFEVIIGNAAIRETLDLANVAAAQCIIVAIPNAFEAGQAVEQCRKLNAGLKIIARAHADEEVDYLERLGADEVIMGEREIGLGMIAWLNGQIRYEAAAAREPSATASARLSGGENLLRQVSDDAPVAPPVVAAGIDAAVADPAQQREPTLEAIVPSNKELVAAPSLAPAVSSEARLPDATSVIAAEAAPTGAAAIEPPIAASEPAPARVVPSADIIILPPKTPGRPAPEPEVPFRSAFWGEDAPIAAEADEGLSAVSPEPVEDDGSVATLEREWVADSDSDPQPTTPSPEAPTPAPEPVSPPPAPHEVPNPVPQPVETPRPQEDPVRAPEPVEPTTPPEIPATPQPGPLPTPTTPPRATGD